MGPLSQQKLEVFLSMLGMTVIENVISPTRIRSLLYIRAWQVALQARYYASAIAYPSGKADGHMNQTDDQTPKVFASAVTLYRPEAFENTQCPERYLPLLQKEYLHVTSGQPWDLYENPKKTAEEQLMVLDPEIIDKLKKKFGRI